MRGLGTLVIVSALLAGAAAGTLIGRRLPEGLRETLMVSTGLFGLVLGVRVALSAFDAELSAAVGPAAPLLVLGVVVAGALVGELLQLEARLGWLGRSLQRRLAGGAPDRTPFVQGFMVGSLGPCVGPLAVMGAFADGLHGDVRLLAVKARLDRVAALVFATQLGWGVAPRRWSCWCTRVA